MKTPDLSHLQSSNLKLLLSALIVLVSVGFWLLGLFNSSILDPDGRPAVPPTQSTAADSTQAEQLQRLAETYWNRYPDIRKHHYFGENGPMGINGAWQHYRQHGRHEGRIFWPQPEINHQAGDSERTD